MRSRLTVVWVTIVVSIGMAFQIIQSANAQTSTIQSEQESRIGQAEFSDLLLMALTSYPQFVVDHQWSGDHGKILSTSEGKEVLETLVRRSTVPGTVVQSSPFRDVLPYRDQAKAERKALDATSTLGMTRQSRYNPESNTIDLTIFTNSALLTQMLITREYAKKLEALVGPRIITHVAPDPGFQLQARINGGEAYNAGCTGNFVAVRNGIPGILTAAHCDARPLTYNGMNTGATFVADGHDYRFTEVYGEAFNSFRDSSTTSRPITSLGVPSVGLSLSKYGKITGYGNSTVKVKRGCLAFSNGSTYCDLYEMSTTVTSGGDSGGPWFSVYKGYGLTTGAVNGGGTLITPVGNVTNISGFPKVRLQP